jgi:hypothetical protein
MGRGSRKRSLSGASEKMERAGDREGKTEGLFDRPKPTVGCSANGSRRRIQTHTATVCCVLSLTVGNLNSNLRQPHLLKHRI